MLALVCSFCLSRSSWSSSLCLTRCSSFTAWTFSLYFRLIISFTNLSVAVYSLHFLPNTWFSACSTFYTFFTNASNIFPRSFWRRLSISFDFSLALRLASFRLASNLLLLAFLFFRANSLSPTRYVLANS